MQNPLKLEQISNRILRKSLKKISSIDKLEKFYDIWIKDNNVTDKNDIKTAEKFINFVLEQFNVDANIKNDDFFDKIPKTGSLIIVSNHPLGGLEGMLLAKILLKIRPDLKVLTNKLLKIFPEFDELFIGVDVLNNNRQKENASSMRNVAKHLSNKGALLIFPAGTVAKLKMPSLEIEDNQWTDMVAKLVLKYKCSVLPVFIDGRNPYYFYLSGYIHKRLRTALLPRAMFANSNQNLPVYIGKIINSKDLKKINCVGGATSYLRLCCEALGKPANENEQDQLFLKTDSLIKGNIDKGVLINHIESLHEYILCENQEFASYCVPYDKMSVAMEELAIIREHTFRAVDEGTGNELDSDNFDCSYHHLFLWDKKSKKIAGGYRIGLTDKIIQNNGLAGLYSHSLFKYNKKFLNQIGKTIELGRSFVAYEYQGHPQALDMLWKGIGAFVEKNPDYHSLFGCVSISRQYCNTASSLLVRAFLRHYSVEKYIKNQVKPRKPILNLDKIWTDEQIEKLSQIPIINKLVGQIQADKNIPTLIKYYLALNGQFVSFTVNEGFNNSLDGLIIVDLRNAPDKYLKRYISEEGLHNFKQKWGDNAITA